MCSSHVLIVKRVGGGLFGHHKRLLQHMYQTFAELLVQSVLAPASVMSSLWIIMGMMIGLTSFLPSIVAQASLSLLMLCANSVDIEAFVVLVLLSWWIRDIHIIC